MGKNKMIAKSCPKCDLQVAVASKTCKCGHTFFSTRKNQDLCRSASPTDDIMRRRTSRVRRGKPQYYDSQEYVKKKRKSPRKGSRIDDKYNPKDKGTAARKRRALRRTQKESSQNGQSNGGGNGNPGAKVKQMKPGQLARCSVILAEINRKMFSVTCRPGGS